MKIVQWLNRRLISVIEKGGGSIFFFLFKTFLGVLIFLGVTRFLVTVSISGSAGLDVLSILRDFYITFLQMTDPGNMSQDISTSLVYKVLAIASGVAGILLLSSLVAILTNELGRRVSIYNKGKTTTRLAEHTLILGWNEFYIKEIIGELIRAKESEDRPVVLILSGRDKVHMDDYLNYTFRSHGNLTVVTRSGNITSIRDLTMVCAEDAASVILLPTCENWASDADKSVSDNILVKALIALSAMLQGRPAPNLVTEIYHESTYNAVRNLVDIDITPIRSKEILSKVIAQLTQSHGASRVYNEILSFSGNEIYPVRPAGGCRTFADALANYADGLPVGVIAADGRVSLCPEDSLAIDRDTHLLVLARDDSAIASGPTHRPARGGGLAPRAQSGQARPQQILLVNWNASYPYVVRHLAEYLPDGSSMVFLNLAASDCVDGSFAPLGDDYPGISFRRICADALTFDVFESLDLERFDSIVAFSGDRPPNEELADSNMVMTLMFVKEILSRTSKRDTNLIAEIHDTANYDLVEKIGVIDFIVSKKILGMLYAQLSQSPSLVGFYDTLFASSGSEIYLKRVGDYFVEPPGAAAIPFREIVAASRTIGDLCIGLRTRDGGIALAPPASSQFCLDEDDSLIVLSPG